MAEIGSAMREMVLETPGWPLQMMGIPVPAIRPEDILIRVDVCAVCRS